MRKYERPECHFVYDPNLDCRKAAELSDQELAERFQEMSFQKAKMKYGIISDYVLRNIAGEYVIVPTGEQAVINNAVMAPNYTALFLWKAFQEPHTMEDVVVEGMEHFEVDADTLRSAVERFVSDGLKYGFMREEV